jgi:hypothetical protein
MNNNKNYYDVVFLDLCFVIFYLIKRVQVNQDGLKLNGTVHISFWLMPMVLTCWEEAYIL